MVRKPARPAALALAVGMITIGVAGCSSSDPVADYVADVRGALSEGDNASVNDNGIIFAGKAICSMREQAEASPATFGNADVAEIALENCDVLATADPTPGDGFPAGGQEGLAGEAEANAGESAGLTERGALPAQIGQRIESWGPPMATGIGQYFTITDIRPVSSCAGQGVGDQGQLEPVKPTNGRFMAVDLKIENTKDFDGVQAGYYPGGSQQYDFVNQDGTALDQVDTLDAFYCTGEEEPFAELKPGRTYTGTKYVDVSNSAGWLIFGQSPNGGPGYEYQVPAA